jgi:hypothetical protein
VSWNNGDGPGDLQQYADDLSAGVSAALSNGSSNGASDGLGINSTNSAGQKMQQQDALAVAQNGGITINGSDEGDLDGNSDDGLDDDMMDKISSSPSIEDGGYTRCTTPNAWPRRVDSLLPPIGDSPPSPCPASSSFSEARPSSPCLETAGLLTTHAAQSACKSPTRKQRHHHLRGEYADSYKRKLAEDQDGSDDADATDGRLAGYEMDSISISVHKNYSASEGHPVVVVVNTENSLGRVEAEKFGDSKSSAVNVDEAIGGLYDQDALTIPYDGGTDDDDDDDFPFETDDTDFIDSGWAGECLHDDIEDIDFEFVYALHTFVATVEGQANATKGDTMVLLDDSNSYWWLVRVVKDSSIGM